MDEKRVYVTRFFNWWRMHEVTQGTISGIMKAVCWPVTGNVPSYLYTTAEANQWEWYFECECTAAQYEKFAEIIRGHFNNDKVEFDYKME